MSPRSLVLGLITTIALAACGGAAASSAPSTQAPSSPAPLTQAPTSPAGQSSSTPSDTPTAIPSIAAPTVAIIDNGFTPASLTVAAGSTVTWTNTGQRDHTVSTSDASFGSDGVMKSGATYAHTFATAGTFAYFCAIHSGMKGTITVTP